MSFQSVPVVEEYQFYLDTAFRRAEKAAGRLSSTKLRGVDKAKALESSRIATVTDILVTRLMEIEQGFPSFDGMDDFYRTLARITLNYDEVKHSLGAVKWAAETIRRLRKDHERRITKADTAEKAKEIRKAFYGRASSVLKKIGKNLHRLIQTRRILVEFPVIKDLPTICITGFPNVGKTTLLSRITSSTPDIQPYAFTTKSLNIGYLSEGNKKIQVIDTPGTLARPEKMNLIEMQAYLVLKHHCDLIVYVWDVTEPYPMEDQEKLFKIVKKYNQNILEFVSKVDIVPEEDIEKFKKKRKNVISDVNEIADAVSEALGTDNGNQKL